MKRLKKLKLTTLNNGNLENREMNKLRGGGTIELCCCGCMYEGTPGGSTINANHVANTEFGYNSENCAIVTPKPKN